MFIKGAMGSAVATLSILAVLATNSTPAIAQGVDSTSPEMLKAKEENAQRLAEGMPEITAETIRKVDQARLDALADSKRSILPAAAGGDSITLSDVTIGTDATFYSATEGNYGGSWWLVGQYNVSYVLAQRRNNVGVTAIGVGGASGWAWTGERFNVAGSGSGLAYVDFDGWARASLLGGVGGTASWDMVVKVFDASTGSYIAEATVFQADVTNNQMISDGSDFTRSLLVSLQAGHQYVVQVITLADVNEYAMQTSRVETGTDSFHTHWDYVSIRWQ